MFVHVCVHVHACVCILQHCLHRWSSAVQCFAHMAMSYTSSCTSGHFLLLCFFVCACVCSVVRVCGAQQCDVLLTWQCQVNTTTQLMTSWKWWRQPMHYSHVVSWLYTLSSRSRHSTLPLNTTYMTPQQPHSMYHTVYQSVYLSAAITSAVTCVYCDILVPAQWCSMFAAAIVSYGGRKKGLLIKSDPLHHRVSF